MKIYEKLKKERKAKGITQEKMAEKLETTQAMIWRYENGKVQMTIPVFKKWCETTDSDANEILGLKKRDKI
jgi:transcriptional regulator with XRE-family HTH domain